MPRSYTHAVSQSQRENAFRSKQSSRERLLVRAPDSLSKGCEFESPQERRVIFFFFSPESTLCADSCSVSVPPPPFRVTAVARERPRLFCQKCRWQVQLNTHTPLTQRNRSGLTMPLSRHSAGTYPETSSHRNLSGNIRQQSSQLADSLWTDSCIKSGISVRGLISTSKTNKKQKTKKPTTKKRRRGINDRTVTQNPRNRRKSHLTHAIFLLRVM